LAEKLGAPVATTASGKGIFPETHALSLGVMGTFGTARANTAIGNADLVVAVGTRLGPMDTANESPALLDPTRQVIIQVDIEPLNASWTFPADHALVGTASTVLEQLTRSLREPTPSRRAVHIRMRSPAIADGSGSSIPDRPSEQAPFHPQNVIAIMQEALPPDVVITCDAGENRLFMMHWYRTPEEGDYLQPASGGGMGYAVPAALGTKLAHPNRPVVAVCGDGGFGMSFEALITAVQEEIPITVVVFNNESLGWVRHELGDVSAPTDLGRFDHVQIARAMGCAGTRIDSLESLRVALNTYGDYHVPAVIDIPTSLATSFKDIVQRLPR
jgi:acetolactate synthase-1/2/3 large subunit